MFIYCLCVLPAPVKAQWNDDIADNHHTGSKWAVGIYGGMDFCSNAITSAFAYNFFASSYIGDNIKQQVVSKLLSTNRIGYEMNYGLYAILYNDTIDKKRVFNFFFALRHKSYFNAAFSPDFLKLALYGNAMYAGKTAQLSPLSINNLTYQQGEIGFVCTNFGGNAQFGVGISFLAGQNYSAISAPSASLYTDPMGEYLLLNLNAQSNQSDTSSNAPFINGYGASLDLYFRAPYKIGSKSGTISVSATDMGFMWWNQKSLAFQKDTTYNYNGITINGLSDLQNPNFNPLAKDSLLNKYFPHTKGAFYAPIPTTLNINTNTALSDKFHLELGYTNIFNATAVGYIYAQADGYFSHNWMVALQAGYGGYTTLNGMLLFSKKFKNSALQVKLLNIEGLILPATFGGAGAYVNYVQSF